MKPRTKPMHYIPTLAAICLLTQASALELGGWQTDRPHDWYRWDASHHGKHFAEFGAPVGIVGYTGLRLMGADRPWAWAGATLGAGLAGAAYEVERSKNGSYRDPVDVAWTGLGGAAGAALAWTAETYVIQPIVGRQSAGVACAWRF